jgi:antitoxin (DNA-binding transcriptional repressor) of toxin-antitoxin stability system
MEHGRQVTIDANEFEERFDEWLARADEGVTVVITEEGKVVGRIIPGDPGPKPRRSPKVRITPRQRTGPRSMPKLPRVDISAAEIDRITREAR